MPARLGGVAVELLLLPGREGSAVFRFPREVRRGPLERLLQHRLGRGDLRGVFWPGGGFSTCGMPRKFDSSALPP